MDIIIAKAVFEDEEITRDIGFMNTQIELDLEVGVSNNFTVKFNRENAKDIWYGDFFFVEGEEYGGVFGQTEVLTESNTVLWRGDTFRGRLEKSIIEPNPGQAYLTVSGDANIIIRDLLYRQQLDLIYRAKEVPSINIPSFTFRYENLVEALKRMLATVNYKLKIYTERDNNLGLVVRLEAVPIVDYSETFEFSQDSRIQLRITDKRDGINYLILLGKGELADRMVRYLYISNGVVTVVNNIGGSLERVAVFDYPNAESEEKLIEAGTKRLLELADFKKLEFSELITEESILIDDIVGARDWTTGQFFKRPIESKNIKVTNGKLETKYKVKGE